MAGNWGISFHGHFEIWRKSLLFGGKYLKFGEIIGLFLIIQKHLIMEGNFDDIPGKFKKEIWTGLYIGRLAYYWKSNTRDKETIFLFIEGKTCSTLVICTKYSLLCHFPRTQMI